MTTILEIILSACFFGLMGVWWVERTLKQEAIDGWARCLRERTELAHNNYELRANLIALAMRNEDLENQISAMTSRRYERN